MVIFFFYAKLTDTELIKKINNNFEINDGYIIENYDRQNNILNISDNSINNNKLLYGKIVKFNMKLEDVIIKINEIQEIKLKNTNYILNTIWTNSKFGGVYKAYIIY